MRGAVLLLSLYCLLAAGCQAPGVRMRISAQQARQARLNLGDGIAADEQGCVYLAAGGGIMALEPDAAATGQRILESSGIRDIAWGGEGTLLVIKGPGLYAWLGGYLFRLCALPGDGVRLSSDSEHAYITVAGPGQATQVLRYSLQAKELQPLMSAGERLDAICAVRGGCLLAAGNKVFRLAIMPPQAGRPAEHRMVMLFALSSPVTSLAADAERKIVYFCDDNTTYAWADGRVTPILPAGGRLALARDALSVADPASGQVVQIQSVSGHLAKITRQFAAARPR